MTGKEASWTIRLKMFDIGMMMPEKWVKENTNGSKFMEAIQMACDLLDNIDTNCDGE